MPFCIFIAASVTYLSPGMTFSKSVYVSNLSSCFRTFQDLSDTVEREKEKTLYCTLTFSEESVCAVAAQRFDPYDIAAVHDLLVLYSHRVDSGLVAPVIFLADRSWLSCVHLLSGMTI